MNVDNLLNHHSHYHCHHHQNPSSASPTVAAGTEIAAVITTIAKANHKLFYTLLKYINT